MLTISEVYNLIKNGKKSKIKALLKFFSLAPRKKAELLSSSALKWPISCQREIIIRVGVVSLIGKILSIEKKHCKE